MRRMSAPSTTALAVALALLSLPGRETSAQTAPNPNLTAEDAQAIARDAYVYAYPMLLQEMTRRQATNVAETQFPHSVPNQLAHAAAFPPPDMKLVIRPNADTLYSAGWMDTGPEPVVLTVPATDRYFMVPLYSLWTDVFAVPGSRTTGPNTARNFLVVGPRWTGQAPAGLEIIRSPTRWVGTIGRTQASGPADYAAVHKVQAGIKLTPLSAWGKADYVPPKGKVDSAIDMKTPPPEQVERMDAATYFATFAELLKDNPPNQVDYPIVQRLEQAGFKVGQSFDLNAAPAIVREAFQRGYADGRALLAEETRRTMGAGTGWTYRIDGGAYGVNYPFRAAIAKFGLGYNLPQDAVYPSLATDSEGRPLDGRNAYVLHFDKDKLPPVEPFAFWSLTAYDPDGYFIPNPLNRQAIGNRSNLAMNADGSLDLYIQAESPGSDREANWLPVAKGPFNLLMRLYSPRREVLDRTWAPPPVRLRETGGARALQ